MNTQLEQYIQTHKVTSANFLVFRDWEEFLNILFSNNGHVEMIIWYEYCRINEQRIGMGGYIDEKSVDICGRKLIFTKKTYSKNQ